MDYSPAGKMCSFCGKQGKKETDFVGGFGVMMCVECLDYYHEAVHTPSRRRAMKTAAPPWEKMTETELLEVLPKILSTAEQVNAFATGWVKVIRDRDVSWARIGKALKVSRQAAWVRFANDTRDDESTEPQRRTTG